MKVVAFGFYDNVLCVRILAYKGRLEEETK